MQKTVLVRATELHIIISHEYILQNMLIACQVPNIPPADNHVATKTVLAAIGSDLIDYRSFAKAEVGSIY